MLAHDYEDAAGRECLTLDEGLDHFAGEVYAGVQFDVDLKLPGYEREVVEGLAERGLGRALACVHHVPREPRPAGRAAAGAAARLVGSARAARLHALGARAARIRRVPLMRARLPGQAVARMRAGGCEAIMVHRLLVGRS